MENLDCVTDLEDRQALRGAKRAVVKCILQELPSARKVALQYIYNCRYEDLDTQRQPLGLKNVSTPTQGFLKPSCISFLGLSLNNSPLDCCLLETPETAKKSMNACNLNMANALKPDLSDFDDTGAQRRRP